MGKVIDSNLSFRYTGINKAFVFELKKLMRVDCFVETGTYQAETLIDMYNYFNKLYTIEASEGYYNRFITEDVISRHPKACFIKGKSQDELPKILANVTEPCLFYLDSHYMEDVSFGKGEKQPLLDELNIICNSDIQHAIIIDDVSFIVKPCCLGQIEEWPSIDEIVEVANQKHKYYVSILHDCMYLVPKSCKKIFTDSKVYNYYDWAVNVFNDKLIK